MNSAQSVCPDLSDSRVLNVRDLFPDCVLDLAIRRIISVRILQHSI